MHFQTDILIIGGGLAGLTAALHLQQSGLDVLLIEKNTYPGHKVCGEYISNEVLSYLQWLDADPGTLNPTAISRLQFSTLSGNSIMSQLPLGGFGISRYALDHFLLEKFVSKGGRVIQDTVTSVSFNQNSSAHKNQQEAMSGANSAVSDQFIVHTLSAQQFYAKQVIGAYGKRAAIDIKLKRDFIQQRAPFLAVKAHYSGDFPEDLIGLHNFSGGYCGVSKIEDQKINICYLADYATFKKYKNTQSYQEKVLYKNKELKKIFENTTCLFNSPLTVSQLSFGSKETVKDHILLTGDTAGLIHPLCGNGMSMAIHSAKICAELLILFFKGTINTRTELEQLYTAEWNQQFKSRMRMGSMLSAVLRKERLADFALNSILRIPSLLPLIIRKTHGKNLVVKE